MREGQGGAGVFYQDRNESVHGLLLLPFLPPHQKQSGDMGRGQEGGAGRRELSGTDLEEGFRMPGRRNPPPSPPSPARGALIRAIRPALVALPSFDAMLPSI